MRNGENFVWFQERLLDPQDYLLVTSPCMSKTRPRHFGGLYILCVCLYACICILCSKESNEAVRSLHDILLKHSGLISKDPQHFLKALSGVDHTAHACGVVVIL